MGGFKHQFEVGCLSRAFVKPPPDGKYLCEKMIMRSTNIRVQGFPQSMCSNHVHVGGCSI